MNYFRHSCENCFKVCTKKTEVNAEAIATCLTYASLHLIYIWHWLLIGPPFPTSRSHWFFTFSVITLGQFQFYQKFRKFQNGDKWYENFLGKFSKILEIVQFPKSEILEFQTERRFLLRNFWIFGSRSRGCPVFRKLCEFFEVY